MTYATPCRCTTTRTCTRGLSEWSKPLTIRCSLRLVGLWEGTACSSVMTSSSVLVLHGGAACGQVNSPLIYMCCQAGCGCDLMRISCRAKHALEALTWGRKQFQLRLIQC